MEIKPENEHTGLGDQMRQLIQALRAAGVEYEVAARSVKREYLIQELRACDGNQCRAARALRMHRNTLSRTLAELGIQAAEFVPMGGRKYRRQEATRR